MVRPGAAVLLLLASCTDDRTRWRCPPACPVSSDDHHLGRQPAGSPIADENARPGDARWREGVTAGRGELEAYATRDAVEAGESLAVRVRAVPPARLKLLVYRLGFYAGAGARLVETLPEVEAGDQPPCPMARDTGLVECSWSDTTVLKVGPGWLSGLYLAKLVRFDGVFRFAPFVVRDRRAADVLFTTALQTSQAYNRWGGASLYGDSTGTLTAHRAFVVGHDRPFEEADGAGQMLRWEFPIVQFLESTGYDVTYGANGDFDRFDDVLTGIGLLVHGGHDEYWTASERGQVDSAVERGDTSLVHLGANGGYWRVRLEPSPDGRPGRRVVCFKNDVTLDTSPGSTVRFRDPPDPRPEAALFGAAYGSYQVVAFPLVVRDAAHWALAGTGLSPGDILPGLLGYEFDQVVPGVSPPATAVLMDSPVVTTTGAPATAQMVIRDEPSERVVFSAGSIYFPRALAPAGPSRDDRVARLVENVLERGLEHRRPMRPPHAVSIQPLEAAPRWSPAQSITSLSPTPLDGPTGVVVLPSGVILVAETNRHRVVALDGRGEVTVVAGDGTPGARDGDGRVARFRQPNGLARRPDGSVAVADTLNHAIRVLTPTSDGWHVTTLAGSLEEEGSVDAVGRRARFNRPTGLASDDAGALWVADQGNHLVRRVDASSGRVTTTAGRVEGGDADGKGRRARFLEPSAVAWMPGALFVVDAGNGRVKRIDLGTRQVVSLAGMGAAGRGFADGPGDRTRLRAQLGLVVLPDGRVVVGDTGNHRLRVVAPGADAFSTQVRTLAGTGRTGTVTGTADASDIGAPGGLAVDTDGSLIVTDGATGRLLRFVP
ncbi:MAG: hypothetical protein RL199_1023 [Pseudomonadota bacterium]|jgi:sugar lactone lactonase YvrE